jgi:predicted phosphodiesterase
MRLAIISDIHGNAEALRAVLRELGRDPVSEIVCLGDLVGYNAQPHEVIALVRERGIHSVHGNHDLMTLGLLPVAGGPRARRGTLWTGEVLNDDDRRFLGSLPGELERPGGMLFVHSAPRDPLTRLKTEDQLVRLHEAIGHLYPAVRICFTGHTHEQRVVEILRSGGIVTHGPTGRVLRRDSFYFINPGSVGEPRGPDGRAAYALYDTEPGVLAFRRVDYDRARVIRENHRRGFPLEPQHAPGRRLGARALAAARRLLGVSAGYAS